MQYVLRHWGKGFDFFKIQIVNFLLQIVSLGLYYPWAKANTLEYLYSHTTLQGHPFSFSGTGKEMFKGYVKLLLFMGILFSLFFILVTNNMGGWGLLLIYLTLFLLIPLALHGSYRYRMAKTSWRGIRFGYTGNRGELFLLFIVGLFLTIITLGIYGPWFYMKLRRYIIGNIKMGDAHFSYSGNGGDFFVLNLVGYILSIFTLGIYMFWWQRDLFRFFLNNLRMQKGDQVVRFQSTASAGDFFSFIIINLLIVVFTLGLGIPWVIIRSLQFVTEHIKMQGNISLEELQQEQEDFGDAAGEDVIDWLNFDLII
jgi:uncharacterized membrane protein YjgN (DUF898 family)